MAHPKFAIGSIKNFRKARDVSEEDEEPVQTKANEKCEIDEETSDPKENQRVMMVRGNVDHKPFGDEQEKELDDMWNELTSRPTESVGKNHNETQFLMIGDVLTVTISFKNIFQYKIFAGREKGTEF